VSRQRPSDSKQLRRQLALVRLLSAAGRSFTIKQLADQLRVSKSTIERDLATLESLFPLVEEAAGKQKRRYRIDQHARDLDALRPFGAMHLFALHVALEMMQPLRNLPVHDDLLAVAQIVRALLADRHNGGLDNLARVFRAEHADPPVVAAADVVDDLVDAIAQGRTCDIRFRTRGRSRPATLGIAPRQLIWRRGTLCLACDDETHDLSDVAAVEVHKGRRP
jgi:predicted DNA-binding transcriptional regulator YafY